jgi:chromosome partitioning protein
MILTVASYKGGVGKTTTAVHLAGYLQTLAPTVLIDGDPNRSSTAWAKRGSLPFKVVDERQMARHIRDFEHIVIDTQARPEKGDLEELVEGCDLLVVPSTPDVMALEALMLTVAALKSLGATRYRVLLTVVPPKPSHDGAEARTMLAEEGLALFDNEIRRLAAFQKAALAGVLVDKMRSADSRAGLGWRDYFNVGKEILK